MAALIPDVAVEEVLGVPGVAPDPVVRRRRKIRYWRGVVLVIAGLYFLLPLYAGLRFSVKFDGAPADHFSFYAIAAIPHQTGFGGAFFLSLRLAIVTTVLVMGLMVPTAVYVHLKLPKLRRVLEFVTILPIVIPPIVLILGVLDVAPLWLRSSEYLLSLVYVILALPFVYRSLDAGLTAIDLKTLVEASRSLGGRWTATLRCVILPNLRAALLSATVLTIALVLGEFTMASLDLWSTLPVWIYQFSQLDSHISTAVSMLSLVGTWVLLLAIVSLDRSHSRRRAEEGWKFVTSTEEQRPMSIDDTWQYRAVTAGLPTAGAPVELSGLVRQFGSTRALDGFSITIEPGEFVALLGPSGCGKTTALRVLAGFERIDHGSVLVDGKEISSVAAQKRDMGMVFQSYSLFPNMNAVNNVAYGLRMRGQRGADRKKKAHELLELVGLSQHATKYPHQMSGGQQQRVALARALAIEPRVLLLDEPLSALDAKVRADLRDQIRSLQQRLAITTVFVTHDQEEALSMADRVCVMSEGKNEQTASPATLYARPATPFVAQFVGVSSRLPVDHAGTHVDLFGRQCPVRGGIAADHGALDVLLRPEDLTVEPDEAAGEFVVHKSFLGATTRLAVKVGDHTVRVDLRSDVAASIELGTRVRPSVIARDVLVAPRLPSVVTGTD